MIISVQLREEAERDIAEAASWYEKQRVGLGHEFLDEVSAALDAIAERPDMYPVVHRGVHRALIGRFPFGVFTALPETLLSCLQSCMPVGALGIGREEHNQALQPTSNPLRGLVAAERRR